MSSLFPLLIGLLFSCSALASSQRPWSANDLSILLPIHKPSEHHLLLHPKDSAQRGELLPRTIFDAMPRLVQGVDQKLLYERYLRVIGIRLDPCFAEGQTPIGCRRQIRLVWQPVLSHHDRVTTLDTALHTFHEFSEHEWNVFLEHWRELASGHPNDALQIHPLMKQEGLSGPYWSQARRLLLSSIGADNLVRITAMTVRGRQRIWDFMGWNITSGKLQPIQIATLSSSHQVIAVALDDLQEFRGNIHPPPTGVDSFLPLVRNSRRAMTQLPETTLKEIARNAVALENPLHHNPGTVDCVSCHIAQTVRLWSERNFPEWAKDFSSEQFVSDRNTTNTSTQPTHVNRLRNFGYFNDEPAISQRVINETAAVLDLLQG